MPLGSGDRAEGAGLGHGFSSEGRTSYSVLVGRAGPDGAASASVVGTGVAPVHHRARPARPTLWRQHRGRTPPRRRAGLPEALKRLRRAARRRAETRGDRHAGWRVAKPLAFAGAGLLLVASAVNSDGTDLRPERYQSLADLAQQQSQRVEALQQEITTLNADIDDLSAGLRERAADAAGEAGGTGSPTRPGMEAVEGPGPDGRPRRRAREGSRPRPATTSRTPSCTSRTSRPSSTRCGPAAPRP